MVDSAAAETHSYTYDNAYRVQRDTQGTRGYIDYTYNSADRISTYSVQNGPNAIYTYYDNGSLKTITWSAISGQFTYQYNLRGQYNSITFPNGQHRDFSYDDQGRLTQIANIHPSAGNLATYTYGYDVDHATGQNTMLGQRTSMNATVPAQGFSNHQTKYYYDNSYQLKQADYPNVAPFSGEVHQWTYDAIGNRLTNTINSTTQNYTYFLNGSSQNTQKLQSDSVYTYTDDNNGSALTKTGSEGTYNFTWDKDNQLTNLTGPSVTGTYAYDYKGRRRSKDSGGGATTMLYGGQNLIAERGTLSADFLFGPGIDEPLAMVRSTTQYYFVTDGLGSINVMNDSVGSVQNSYVFDSWGVTRGQTIPVSNPFTYTARETAEAGLLYYRARYYSHAIGRFASEDPIGFEGGTNFYAYAFNDPVRRTDPFGLSPEPPVPPGCIAITGWKEWASDEALLNETKDWHLKSVITKESPPGKVVECLCVWHLRGIKQVWLIWSIKARMLKCGDCPSYYQMQLWNSDSILNRYLWKNEDRTIPGPIINNKCDCRAMPPPLV